jgi:hypothetical protein
MLSFIIRRVEDSLWGIHLTGAFEAVIEGKIACRSIEKGSKKGSKMAIQVGGSRRSSTVEGRERRSAGPRSIVGGEARRVSCPAVERRGTGDGIVVSQDGGIGGSLV